MSIDNTQGPARMMPTGHTTDGNPNPSNLNRMSDDRSGKGPDVVLGAHEGQSLDDVLAVIERREIVAALERAKGQRTMAAQFLRISRSRLYRRMEALGIESSGAPPGPGE